MIFFASLKKSHATTSKGWTCLQNKSRLKSRVDDSRELMIYLANNDNLVPQTDKSFLKPQTI